MAGLCEGDNETAGSLKAICKKLATKAATRGHYFQQARMQSKMSALPAWNPSQKQAPWEPGLSLDSPFDVLASAVEV
ncbi:hypothetical protein ANN_00671 [Periplaneta americana]|uniref:Uncharacterized protein n=1 Tax=Periplaneta americana TaxID=6978 RepID=A0ABQ8TSI3_PERAM|nr:hypothetical protein ANN_00671 [Periplaneta americana]